ncbi:glycosyltransferase family 2 protein [Catellatospora citrea]|uniref:glycosyltransferase family 2 protein n=1 Tax=Catellatospora citrea TaxID=53366 RepID=UPI0033E77677
MSDAPTSPAADELTTTRVAVVIVTYNSAAVLPACLDALTAVTGVTLSAVVVADNASRDESLAVARAAAFALPVVPVAVGRNAGYAAAVNAGLAALDPASYDAVFVLNPDCSVSPEALAVLAAALRRPGCGITAPLMLNADGSLQPSLRRAPTVRRALGEALLGRRAERYPAGSELVTDPAEYREPHAVSWATGAALLISADAAREVGPWEESFLLFSEETEYCLRAADHGHTTWFEPAAVVTHIGGPSGKDPFLSKLIVWNRVRLFRSRHGALRSGAYYLATLLGQSMRALRGRPEARAATEALLFPSRRVTSLAE